MPPELLIVGSSARAAAQSALRAGWRPCAIDQFNDVDLTACCSTRLSRHYPKDIVALSCEFANGPVIYTGALENHPKVIEALSRLRPLLGNDAERVQAVRNPWKLHQVLSSHDLRVPALRQLNEPLDNEPLVTHHWLLKPWRSGGGIGIRAVVGGMPTSGSSSQFSRVAYYQQFVRGLAISAQFVAARGQAAVLGVTRQLVGSDWAGAEHFLYVGNIGDLVVSSKVAAQLQRIGDVLAQNFQLQGLFGVDAILSDEDVWTVEVNPRYTAAMEILERSLGVRAIELHVSACRQQQLPDLRHPARGEWHGKAVLYARSSVVIPSRFSSWAGDGNASSPFPVVADLPQTGTLIERGRPVCTIFASGCDERAVEDSLRELADEVYYRIRTGR